MTKADAVREAVVHDALGWNASPEMYDMANAVARDTWRIAYDAGLAGRDAMVEALRSAENCIGVLLSHLDVDNLTTQSVERDAKVIARAARAALAAGGDDASGH